MTIEIGDLRKYIGERQKEIDATTQKLKAKPLGEAMKGAFFLEGAIDELEKIAKRFGASPDDKVEKK